MGTDGAEWGTAQRGDNNASARARTALSEALAELRRLTRDPLFDGVERALASLGNTPIEPEFGVETVRRLGSSNGAPSTSASLLNSRPPPAAAVSSSGKLPSRWTPCWNGRR